VLDIAGAGARTLRGMALEAASPMRSVVAALAMLALAGCPSSQRPPGGGGDDDGSGGPDGGTIGPDGCTAPRTVGDFALCAATTESSYTVIVKYTGAGKLALAGSRVTLGGAPFDAAPSFDAATQTFTLHAEGLAPSKYSFLFRLRTDAGQDLRPLFVPMWIGPGVHYADFTWHDAIIYQIFTDRFLDADPGNDLDNSQGDLARVTDRRSQWQGGDFAGITKKIKDGYFDAMGVNTLWISSPIIDSHDSQPAVALADHTRYASYHSYHPVATGYTDLDHLGYATPIEPAFGTAAELHELVAEAHKRGMRILTDFVANHLHKGAKLYALHPDWFFPYNACDNRWDEARLGCWFTTDTPDFDYGAHPDAVKTVVDHALWMIQEFDLDGFRADALKHMDDKFVRALKAAVVAEIETTVVDHAKSEEPTVFYMVGESLGGWARYHVRADMVQGQVDEGFYYNTKGALLTFDESVRQLAEFAIPNDTAYLTPQDTMGGRGGYPGAVMGNFFGNHDQVRALTEAKQKGGGYERLRLAQTFLMTSPKNVPMLYQGDEYGTEGGPDPDNRKMQRFEGLTADEQATLANLRKAGSLRAAHPALRRGTRTTVVLEDWFWVYEVKDGTDDVYVAINRDDTKTWSPPAGFVDGLGNCANGKVPILSSCIFVRP
jgi:glycosidase